MSLKLPVLHHQEQYCNHTTLPSFTCFSMGTDFVLEGRLIAAVCKANNGIGFKGTIPWPRLRGDLASFRAHTDGYPVLMGSATYTSLPPTACPLPGRLNIVLSRRSRQQLQLPSNVLLANSLEAAETLLKAHGLSVVYVIGGQEVYQASLQSPNWSTRLLITEVEGDFPADRYFPLDRSEISKQFSLVSVSSGHSDNGISYAFTEYVRRSPSRPGLSPFPLPSPKMRASHEEWQYLDLVRRVLDTGVRKGDRTGTGTLSLFGEQLRFSLRENVFPLLTTKRVFWRGVAEELFWFIRGCTNSKELADKRVHIWDANGSREFLDNLGFNDREEGDLGPVYGFQWRHFGADYTNAQADYAGKGVDQLSKLINMLRTNPSDRRMLISAWNPAAIHEMALPPCHLMAQFYVANGELSCQMYQRSGDVGLGVPFNIASYALLTRLITNVVGLSPGEFVHVIGDTHIYLNHVNALKEQLTRTPKPFPTLHVKSKQNIEDFNFDDLVLEGYDPHGSIAMKMAV